MKRNAISFLIGISVFLLLVNILIEVFEPNQDEVIPKDVFVTTLDSLFFDVIDQYGLEESWIVKKQLLAGVSDSIDYYYDIKLPPDVPTPYILKDVKNKTNWPAIKVFSEESENFGNSNLKVYSNGVLKLCAKFTYKKDMKRPFAELAFIIESADDMNDYDFQKFIEIPFPFALEITPSKKNEQKKNSIKEFDKEYVILLNDDIDDTTYRLSSQLSKGLLRESIKSIVNSFKDAVYFIVDERSELYHSAVFNFIRDEFKKKGVALKIRSNFVMMNMTNKEEMISLLNFYCTSGKSKKGKSLLISSAGFISLQKEIDKAKKKGHKFILPSKINNPK